jgi:hypothetical protein
MKLRRREPVKLTLEMLWYSKQIHIFQLQPNILSTLDKNPNYKLINTTLQLIPESLHPLLVQIIDCYFFYFSCRECQASPQ